MSTFKFTPKKGVLANLRKSVRASTATAAVTASNGLRAAPTINKAITDGLDSFNMAVTDVLDSMPDRKHSTKNVLKPARPFSRKFNI